MKFSKYFMDKFFSFLIISFNYFIIILILFAFKIDKLLIVIISVILIVTYILVLLFDYYRKRNFYNDLVSNIEKLDKAYLVLEMINTPDFYEGKIIYQALYDINKSMNDNIKNKIIQLDDFKEYVEMWIHEVKVPLASLVLQLNNNDTSSSKTKNTLKITELFNIINTRLLNQDNKVTKTIISTNLSLQDLYEVYEERIVSRIIGNYNACYFYGDDIRIKKKLKV